MASLCSPSQVFVLWVVCGGLLLLGVGRWEGFFDKNGRVSRLITGTPDMRRDVDLIQVVDEKGRMIALSPCVLFDTNIT